MLTVVHTIVCIRTLVQNKLLLLQRATCSQSNDQQSFMVVQDKKSYLSDCAYSSIIYWDKRGEAQLAWEKVPTLYLDKRLYSSL